MVAQDSKFFIKKDFSRYSGKWVAIRNKKIIASNSNINKALAQAKRKSGEEQFFIAKIPQKNQVLIL
ncbi:MAG TPA: DUF5678 domain-containing protein [archaeon]|nr:DUF5678 domain-containing protein [archaeon]